jgi:CRISPR-associated protein Csm4
MAKRKFTIYKLHFTSPLHIGDARDDYSVSLKTIASDTMYAALTSCLSKLGMEVPFEGDLGCVISSLFPFYQKDKASDAVLFFPKPLKQTLPTLNDIAKAKSVKKVSWLDKDYFEKVLNGETLFKNGEDVDNIKGDFLTEDKVFDKDFITSRVFPRVTVSRDASEDAVPFYIDRVFFKDYSGLYFIAEKCLSLIEKALSLLQTEGIGTDRNVGNGFFEYERTELVLNIPDSSEFVLGLSNYIPSNKEELADLIGNDNVAYDFVRRGGWITTPPHNTIRKNAVYAFSASSVFKKKVSGVCMLGKIVDLSPTLDFEPKVNHPIWRCGKALFIPIKL